jgi:hypothetical protein
MPTCCAATRPGPSGTGEWATGRGRQGQAGVHKLVAQVPASSPLAPAHLRKAPCSCWSWRYFLPPPVAAAAQVWRPRAAATCRQLLSAGVSQA